MQIVLELPRLRGLCMAWFSFDQKNQSLPPQLVEEKAGALLDTYGTSLLRLAYTYVSNLADAQEIVQDTLLQYLRKAPHFENEKQEKSWLMTTTANLAKNRARYNRRHAQTSLDVLQEKELVKDPDLSFVWQAVSRLPEKYRGVIHLYYQESLSVKEIAEVLRQKESTITTWLSRGRQQLKRILQEDYDFE